MLDLIPSDLNAEAWLEIAEAVDPVTFRADLFARAAGAGCAMVVTRALMERAGLTGLEQYDRVACATLLARLKRFAPATTGMAIAIGLSEPSETPAQRGAMFRARAGLRAPLTLYVQGVHLGLLLSSLLNPVLGAIGLAVFHVGLFLALRGLPLRARDRLPAAALRFPRAVLRWVRAAAGPDGSEPAVEDERATYRALLAQPQPGYFQPRRTQCPNCGSISVRPAVVSPDLHIQKPGRFVLDRCEACRHVFQNPALSPAGLSFHYRDAYDGVFAEATDDAGIAMQRLYQERVSAIGQYTPPPHNWLDIGTGHGHFFLEVRRRFPEAECEGLDQSVAVEEGVQRGWMHRAWLGDLEQHAGALRGRFDVVSMFHYLEHAPDPKAHLRLAAGLLTEGGKLVLEVPNPDCRQAMLLRQWWLPWFQPQHLQFFTVDALAHLLEEHGLRVEAIQYTRIANDWFAAVMLLGRALSPSRNLPWRSAPSALARIANLLLWAALTPAVIASVLADLLYNLLPASRATSNAYRIVARRVV